MKYADHIAEIEAARASLTKQEFEEMQFEKLIVLQREVEKQAKAYCAAAEAGDSALANRIYVALITAEGDVYPWKIAIYEVSETERDAAIDEEIRALFEGTDEDE